MKKKLPGFCAREFLLERCFMEYDPKKFYEQIGVQGMVSLTSKQKTASYLKFLKPFLQKDFKILDIGCGYGRLTIPLAKEGHNIEGVDLSPNLIEEAKLRAKKENLDVAFKIGDMRSLPYKDDSFDVVICMWSTFSYMLTVEDQVKALEQMARVLTKGGIAIIDLPSTEKNQTLEGTFIRENVLKTKILEIEHVVYLHTKETATNLLNQIKNIGSYEVKYENIGGARRLVLFFKKS